MTLVPHAEKHKVKPGSIAGGQTEVGTQDLFVLAGGLLGVWVLSLDAMHLFRLQRCFGDQGLRRHPKIAIGMGRFHLALIAEKQLHFVPRKLPAEWIADEQCIQSFWRGAASEANAERTTRLRRGVRRFDEFFRGTLGDSCGILQDSCVGVCAIVGHAIASAPAAIPSSRFERAALT